MQYNDAIYFFLLLLKLYLLYLNKRKEIFESTISSSDQKLRKKGCHMASVQFVTLSTYEGKG